TRPCSARCSGSTVSSTTSMIAAAPSAIATWTVSTSASALTCCADARPRWKPNCPTARTAIISSRSVRSNKRNTKVTRAWSRAWPKHQTNPVTVVNLVSEKTIEHKMLETLAHKQALADGVLDLKGNLQEIKLRTGRQAFLAKLEQLVPAKPAAAGNPQLSTLN